jgi:signal transduction histidine kinase
VRHGAIVIGLLAVALATRTTITSTAWIGRTFPGFMLIDNRVIASVGLAHWSGTAVPDLHQMQVVAVDGRPVDTTADVYATVAARPPGTSFRYRLRGGGTDVEVGIASQRFGLRDWILFFGAYLLNSVVYLASGLVVWTLRPNTALGRVLLAFGTSLALWALTAMDLYAPATFFRLHIVGEAIFPATGLHLGLLFPQPHPLARFAPLAYVLAALLAVAYELVLYRPAEYTLVHNLCTVFLGVSGLTFGVRLVVDYVRGPSELARQRIRVMTVGTLLGFALPGAVCIASVVMGSGMGVTPVALTGFLFAVNLTYAIVKHDLFEIDAMVKRSAYYLVLTGAVGAAYVGAVVVFNLLLRAGAVTDSPAFPVAFTLAVLVLFNPLRARLQRWVDRVFFHTRYDGATVLAAVGAELSATLQHDRITALVREAVDGAIPNRGTRLFFKVGDEAPHEAGGTAVLPPALAPWLAEDRVVTTFDSPERYPTETDQAAVRAALTSLDAEVAVPMKLRGELVGALTAGPKRSGLFYTAGDAELLRALAQQAAIALQNAASYQALVELNAGLEARVRERTAQLESANRDLTAAYEDLQHAEVQLVQSEKMASLGRLVAGIAHEINNPVSFIASSVAPLLRRLERAAQMAPPEVARTLTEAEEIVGIMKRGAERTASIVRDLRTFSRLGEAVRKATDLHDGIEVSLRLLESRWRDRIVVHRDYGDLPPVECDAGQMNQVFMNVLANACDAIHGPGNLWITTRADAHAVTVTIRDDGPGIPIDLLGRVFDPFFTTKDVGHGTGLGLAISHSVINAHGGRIEVDSAPGAGATFRIVLPLPEPAALERVASGAR